MPDSKPAVSLASIYRVFFEIGLLSFGGGLVSWIHREVVKKRDWIEDREFLSGVALAQILPGVNSTNVAIFVGQRLRGAVGAATALTAMLTGPFVITIFAAILYQQLLGLPGFSAAVAGVAAVAIGMLLRMGVEAGKVAATGPLSIAVLAATFAGVGVLRLPMLGVVAVIAPLSVAACWPRQGPQGERPDAR